MIAFARGSATCRRCCPPRWRPRSQTNCGDDPALMAIGGRALKEMTRIAASPYSMWRDIALTNTDNIQQAMQRLEQRLAHIRENLKTGELREEFERGNRFGSEK